VPNVSDEADKNKSGHSSQLLKEIRLILLEAVPEWNGFLFIFI